MNRAFLHGRGGWVALLTALAACTSSIDKGSTAADARRGNEETGGSSSNAGASAGGAAEDAGSARDRADAASGGRTASGGRGVSGSGGASGSGVSAGGSGGASNGGAGGKATNLPPLDPSCSLPNAAFCDAFTKESPGGRAGALDDAHWSMSRLGFGCAYSFAFPETPINLCGVWKTVEPGGPDSQFCLNEDNEPRWSEGFDDNTDFNYLSARIRQPFDFEGRTGTIQWEADARTSGSHGWWTETWITADPVPGPNLHEPDQLVTSKEALGIGFDLNCGMPVEGKGTAGAGVVGVSRILLVHDYAFANKYDPFSGPQANARCVKTEQNKMNKFQIKLAGNRVEVWASDAGGTDLIRIAEADIDLTFSRGYVQFSHVHYNAQKTGATTFQSYQWAQIAFDGPQLPVPRAYEIADPLTKVHTDCTGKDVYRIAYGVTDNVIFDIGAGPTKPATLKFVDVDPKGSASARLNFNTTYVAPGDTLAYRLNGKEWHHFEVPAAYKTAFARQGFSVPVPVTDLVAGDNTVEFGTNSNPGFAVPANSMQIANIDLELEVP